MTKEIELGRMRTGTIVGRDTGDASRLSGRAAPSGMGMPRQNDCRDDISVGRGKCHEVKRSGERSNQITNVEGQGMSMLKRYRRLLSLCCGTTVFVGLFGAAAVAGQGNPETTTATNIDEMMRLADLQRRQIVQQRRALSGMSEQGAQPGLQFLLPTNPSALQNMIATHQRIIDSQEQRLAHAEAQPVMPQTPQHDEVVVTVSEPRLVAETEAGDVIEDALILPTNMNEQDVAAREAFEQALASGQQSSETPVVETPSEIAKAEPPMRPAPGLNSRGLVAVLEDGVSAAPATDTSLPIGALHALTPRTIQVAAYQVPADGIVIDDEKAEPVKPAKPVLSEEEQRTYEMNLAYNGNTTVPNPELDEIRAGFVAPNGLIVNIGIVFQTLIDGQLVVENVFNLDNPANALGGFATIIQGADGYTEIINTVHGGGGVTSTVANTQNDIILEQVSTIIIDIPNHAEVFGQVGGGNSFVKGIGLPQTFIDMGVGVLPQ